MRMQRVYEVMFIVRPDAAEEDVDKLIAGFTTTITGGGGVVKTVEKMGRRKLAYLVRKFVDGNYVLLTIEANGAVVLELERRLRVTEPVIKFITVRIDEEEKRLAKVKAASSSTRTGSGRACGGRGCGAGSGERLNRFQGQRRFRALLGSMDSDWERGLEDIEQDQMPWNA
jgi:small subunit ribosomal protein S6